MTTFVELIWPSLCDYSAQPTEYGQGLYPQHIPACRFQHGGNIANLKFSSRNFTKKFEVKLPAHQIQFTNWMTRNIGHGNFHSHYDIFQPLQNLDMNLNYLSNIYFFLKITCT